MDQLVLALVGLINRGSELAGPALYLFFALKFIEAMSFALPVTAAIALGYRLMRLRLTTPTDKVWEYLQSGKPVRFYDEIGIPHFYTPSPDLLRRLGFEKRLATQKEAGGGNG
jgi:hypothetical protein